MTYELQEKIANIITEHILTPVIYMLENDFAVDFICFCDRNITYQDIYEVEKIIKEATGITAEILDIRELDEADRLDAISRSELIHSDHPVIENLFTYSMAEDYRSAMAERQAIIDRKRETGSIYLH